MHLQGLRPSGRTLHRVDRLCRDLNSLSITTQQSVKPSSSLKTARLEGPFCTSRKRARHTYEPVQAAPGPAVAPVGDEEGIDAEEVKAQLLDSLFGLERGLNVSAEVKAEISELILRLETRNPTPSPNAALDLLSGTWKLAYTANSELLALLALNKLPGIQVGDILQKIENASSVENKVLLSGPLTQTSFSAKANLTVSSPTRLQVAFREGRLSTPRLLEDVEFPSSVSLLGQYIDLSRLKDSLQPVTTSFRQTARQLSAIADRIPDVTFRIPAGQRAQSWLVTTYLDSDLRISRGDGGSVFVLVKSYDPAQ